MLTAWLFNNLFLYKLICYEPKIDNTLPKLVTDGHFITRYFLTLWPWKWTFR